MKAKKRTRARPDPLGHVVQVLDEIRSEVEDVTSHVSNVESRVDAIGRANERLREIRDALLRLAVLLGAGQED